MRVLVTGGAGFIGSHLIDQLLNQGNEVICLDNFYTGRKQNIVKHLANPRFDLLRHDVNFPYYCEVDFIYHLACPASPIHYQKDPIQTTKTSILGTLNMLGLAKRLNIPLLFTSTSEIYGDPNEHPQKEDYWGNVNPIGTRSCYDEGKRCAETLCFDYYRQHNIPVKVVRIFNTYGPRMAINDGRVVSNFIHKALEGVDLEIYGDGQQTRSFCYVDDLVQGLTRMADDTSGFTGPVNLGNPIEHTMLELAEKVINLTNSTSKVTFKKLPADDPRRRKPDNSLASKKLAWQPTIGIDEGLSKTISYFSKIIQRQTIGCETVE